MNRRKNTCSARVIEVLRSVAQATVHDLSVRLDMNYTTILQAVRRLQQDGIVIPCGTANPRSPVGAKAFVWKLADGHA